MSLFKLRNTRILVPLILIIVAANFVWAQEKDEYAFGDSLFKKMSIEDLIQIRKYYDKKALKLRGEELSTFKRGMKVGESFLGSEASDIADRDKIYIRVAEYYIEDAYEKFNIEEEEFEKKYTEYEKQLVLHEEGKLESEPAEPEFPKLDYTKAIDIYDRLVEEYPASDYADDALYSKAFLVARMGDGTKSRRVYQEIIDKYPDSRFAPESYTQLAEYYFNPREDKLDEDQIIVELKKAIQLYKKVLKYKDSKRYDEALYKLGWSYYKLAARDPKNYNDAITYFLLVVDDIEKAKKLDPRGEITTPDVRDEAIEYIGISFTDENYTTRGVDKARHMITRIGDRVYGPDIMNAIGQTYQKIDKWENSIYAYNNLLDMYPKYLEAPLVQQKIVDGLVELHKDYEAFQARKKLYSSYGPKSEWYVEVDNSTEKDKVQYLKNANRLSENAMRTNLSLDLEKAQELEQSNQPSIDHYRIFAENCARYLQTFPTDSNAYDVNWSYALVLDSKLGQLEDSYEEYIRVSSDYLETGHRKDAALNAITTADTLVKIKYGPKDTTSFNIADVAKLSPEVLTPEESRLIEALDNYIQLFPVGEYTANFLAQAGGIYYNHKKFAEAKVYYQTLVKRFPGSEYKSLAMRSIMDAYFALGQFKDSEVIAKRIMSDQNTPNEQREFASKRLAAAIFKNAEYLQEQGDYFAAANEFTRVYTETPEDKQFVEPALYNGGLNFEKAKDWVRAIETFNIIASNYPQSKLAINSLERMAEGYKELEQFGNAGDTYRRIYDDYNQSEKAEAALYNSGYYYKKGSEWQKAIDANNSYIASYPTQEFSTDLFFANADLYLKLNNETEANRIYEQFSQKYPNDPRTVTAHYERGNYFKSNNRVEEAKSEYNKAIARSEMFRSQGKDANPFIAGEAVNALGNILHDEFVSIELKQPENNIESQKQRMRSTIGQLNTTYSKVLSFGSPRSFEATYNIARSYEEFAQIYSVQELDPNLSSDKQFVEKKRINDESAQLYEKAVDEYRQVVKNIPIIAEKLGVDMFGEAEEPTTSLLDSLPPDSTQLRRVAEKDSTKELAIKYLAKAKDKISELLYTQASLTTENVYQAINVKAPGANPVSDIVYKLTVLTKVAAPAIDKTIESHIKNIQDAEAMGLSNKYVEESKRQILLTSNIIAEEFEKLANDALTEHVNTSREIKNMLEQEYEAKNSEGLDYYQLDNRAAQMVDYSKIISEEVLKKYENTLILAQEHNIVNDLVKNTEDRILRFSIEITDKMSVIADSSLVKKDYYQAQFDSTENYNYEDGLTFYENYYFNFTDYSREILDLAFEKKETYDIKNLWANKLILKLIKIDPLAYSGSVEKDKIIIASDASWKSTVTYYEGTWVETSFDDSGWKSAQIVESYENQFEYMGLNPNAIWVAQAPAIIETQVDDTLQTASADTLGMLVTEEADTLGSVYVADSLAVTDSSAAPLIQDEFAASQNQYEENNADSTVFFRKSFEIDGTPVSGEIYLTADDNFRFYLNGEYMLESDENSFAKVDTVDYYTFGSFLSKGKNVLMVDVEDKDHSRGGLKIHAVIEVLPADVTAAAAEKAKVKKVVVDSQILEKINTMNKNRISSNR